MRTLYNNIQLHLGIKKKLLKPIYKNIILYFDKYLVYPIYKRINKYIFDKVINHYGADYKWNDQKSQNLNKTTANYGYGLFHYSMVRNQKPKNILCVGSMYGYIPYMLAKGCEENGFGQVDFVDAGFNIKNKKNKKNHYFGQGFWNRKTVKNHFSLFLNQNYIKTYIMTTKIFVKKYPKKTYDYIYIDGDHSYKGAALDFKMFWKKLNKEGFIVFHDIHLENNFLNKEAQSIGLEFGYKKLWKELLKTKKYKFELSNHYSGLGFIQKL